MSTNWNLKVLYESFEDEKFITDMKGLDTLISKVKETAENMTANHEQVKEKLESYIKQSEEVGELIGNLAIYLSLTLSVEATHSKASKYRSQLYQKASQLTEPESKVELWIGEIKNIEEVIASSALLTQHEFYFKEILRAQKYMLTAREEAIIAQMANTGSDAWVNYKDLLISTHQVTVDLDGEAKTMPLTEVLNLAHASDKATRKAAYEAEVASYTTIEEGIAGALNAIKGEVLTVADMRGYDSIIQMTLENSRMKKETLDAMLEAMKETLPVFRKYLRRKAELLGYTKGLPWYEMYAPIVEKEMPFTYEDGKTFVVKNFRTFSDSLADFTQHAMDNEWIDVYPKPGKVGGAFCAGVKSIRESRILLNYGNTLSDVITMAHELGHGFHNHCMKNETYLNSSYPMPLAETASTLCETIVKKAAVKAADDEEKIAIIENELSDCTQVIVDIYSRYIFETNFFEKRKEGYVSVDEIKQLMTEAQKEAYSEGLDEAVLHPYMWTWKSHYYRSGTNFYNFPYAFGLLFAKGLYAKYQEDPQNFPSRYEELLAVTGKMSIEDVAQTIGIDVTDKAFWKASLQTIVEDVEEFMILTNK